MLKSPFPHNIEIASAAVGPGITPFGDLDKQPSSLGEGHHRIAPLPDGFQRPGCHPSRLLACSWSDRSFGQFHFVSLSLALGNSPTKSEV